jgi:hypothetical protein
MMAPVLGSFTPRPGEEVWHLLPGLPAERADERIKVRTGFRDLRRLFLREGVRISHAARLASRFHHLPPTTCGRPIAVYRTPRLDDRT